MAIREEKLKELLERVKSLPEDSTLPEEMLDDLNQDEMIAIFVEKMMHDKGVEPTNELREELHKKLDEEITRQVINAMPDYLVAQLNEEAEKGADDDAINKMIDESGIDVETITEQAMTGFYDNYINGGEEK